MMNGSKPNGPAGVLRTPCRTSTARGSPVSAFPSPRPSPSGRGRIICHFGEESVRLELSPRGAGSRSIRSAEGVDSYSLSLRERVRVRGNVPPLPRTPGFSLASPSPRPSPAGRGRTFRHLGDKSERFELSPPGERQPRDEHPGGADVYSLSLRERVRVRGNAAWSIGKGPTSPRTVELPEASAEQRLSQDDCPPV